MQTTEGLAEELKTVAEQRGISLSDAIIEVVRHLEGGGVTFVITRPGSVTHIGLEADSPSDGVNRQLLQQLAAGPVDDEFKAQLAEIIEEDKDLLDRLAAT